MSRVTSSVVLLALFACPCLAQEPRPQPTTGVDSLGDPLPRGAVARIGSLRLRHAGEMTLAYTADGRHLASLGTDKLFHLWAADSGKEVRRYGNREIVLSAGADGMAYMRGPNGQLIRFYHGGQVLPTITSAFSPDGLWLATVTEQNKAALYNTATGQQLRELAFQFPGTHPLAFSTDGKLLAAADSNGEEHVIRLWDRATGEEVRSLKGALPCSRLLFSPDNRYLGGLEAGQIRLWDVPSGKRVRLYQGHQNAVMAFAFSPNGKLLASAGADQTVRFWDMDSEEETAKIPTGPFVVSTLAFSPDSRTLATGSVDGKVRLWDAATAAETRSWSEPSGAVAAVAWSPDGKVLAAGSQQGTMRLWDPATGKEVSRPRLPGPIRAAGFGPEGTLVLTTVDGGKIQAGWERPGPEKRTAPPKIGGTLLAVAPGGKLQAWQDENNQLLLWDVDQAQPALKLETPISAAALSGDGRWLALAGQDDVVRVWRTAPLQEVRRLENAGKAAQLAFSPNGKTLALVTADNKEIELWELTSGRRQGRIPAPASVLTTLAFSPDGALLAAGGADEVVRLWEVASGRLLRGMVGHSGPVSALAFSPRGDCLATAAEDGVVLVWEVSGGAQQRRLEGHRGGVQSLAFAVDGRYLVSAGKDTTAVVWDLHIPAAAPVEAGVKAAALEQLWAQLGDRDPAVAHRAAGSLAARPDDTLSFLQEQLRPAPRVEEEQLARLIAGLGDGRYAAREKAMKALETLEGQALAAVRKALARNPDPELATRLRSLITRLEAPVTDQDALRALRAVELIERIGTAQARTLLHALAQGAPEARLTQDAQEAWDRLNRRLTNRP